MENSFGLPHLWAQGDAVTRTIAILLLLMSALSWVVIAIKAMDVWRHQRQAACSEQFWHSPDLAVGLAVLARQHGNPFHQLAMTGHLAAEQQQAAHQELHNRLDISDWVQRSLRNAIDENTTRMQSGLAILASIGSIAPFVGLLGTVWGIYHALVAIGATGNASIDAVAGPIGETLIMTALGLAVAIPAVLGYNGLVRGNKFVIARMNRFAHDLHGFFVTGARMQAQRGGRHGV